MIKVVELFAGIGAFRKAFINTNIAHEVVAISEWDVNAIRSYKAMYCGEDDTDYSADFSKSELVDLLASWGISNDGKEPMKKESINRKGEKWIRETYNNIISTRNVVDISQVESLPDVDLITYGFPCQDISIAGKGAGFVDDNLETTRSGLFFESLRLIRDLQPKYAIAENVKNLTSKKFEKEFKIVLDSLEQAGFNNYWKVINAKDHRIPQNRERVFIISIRKDIDTGTFKFPESRNLKLRLRDMLEDEVDEKYFLTDVQLERVINTTYESGKLENRLPLGDISRTLCARDFKDPKLVQVGSLKGGKWDKSFESARRVYSDEGLSPTVHTMGSGNSGLKILIPEKTKKGYAEAEVGDGVYINRPHQKRGVVQKGMIQTLKTSGNDVGVVVRGNYSPSGHNASRIVDKNGLSPTVMENHGTVTAVVVRDTRNLKEKLCDELIQSGIVKGGEIINHSYTSSKQRPELKDFIETKDGIMPTLTTRPDTLGVVVKGGAVRNRPEVNGVNRPNLELRKDDVSNALTTFDKDNVIVVGEHRRDEGIRTFKDDVIGTLRTRDAGGDKVVVSHPPLRIRKLTPKECWRLMGFDDNDFDKAQKVNSNAQLYKQAGNSIVVTVLEDLLKQLFPREYLEGILVKLNE